MISSPLHHQEYSCFFPVLPKSSHSIDTARNPHKKSSKATIGDNLVALFFHIKDHSIHDILIAIFLGRSVQLLMRVDILDIIAVGHSDQKRIVVSYRV